MKGILNTREVNLGQDQTAEPVTTAATWTGQTSEDTATRMADAISVADNIQRLLQISILRQLQVTQ